MVEVKGGYHCLWACQEHAIMQIACTVQDGTTQSSTYFIVKTFYQKGFNDNGKAVLEQCYKQAVYLIIIFNLIVPTLLSPVGDPLLGNGCGSPNHILFMLFLYLLSLFLIIKHRLAN
jgi:hypothetical protein